MKNLDEFLLERRYDRRELLRGGAGLALGIGLAGCGLDGGRRLEGGDGEGGQEAGRRRPRLLQLAHYIDPKLMQGVREALRREGARVQLRLDAGDDGQAAQPAIATT